MASEHRSRIDGLVATRGCERAAVELGLCALHFVIVDLRTQLDHARQRLADATARFDAAAHAESAAFRPATDVVASHASAALVLDFASRTAEADARASAPVDDERFAAG